MKFWLLFFKQNMQIWLLFCNENLYIIYIFFLREKDIGVRSLPLHPLPLLPEHPDMVVFDVGDEPLHHRSPLRRTQPPHVHHLQLRRRCSSASLAHIAVATAAASTGEERQPQPVGGGQPLDRRPLPLQLVVLLLTAAAAASFQLAGDDELLLVVVPVCRRDAAAAPRGCIFFVFLLLRPLWRIYATAVGRRHDYRLCGVACVVVYICGGVTHSQSVSVGDIYDMIWYMLGI